MDCYVDIDIFKNCVKGRFCGFYKPIGKRNKET